MPRSSVVTILPAPILLALGLTLVARPATAQAPPARVETLASLDEMTAAAGAAPRVVLSTSGAVRFLRAAPGAPIPVPGMMPGKTAATGAEAGAEKRARAFLTRHGRAFGLAADSAVVSERVTPRDVAGLEHVRLRQSWRGIPVTAGELGIHLRGGGVVAAHGELIEDFSGVASRPTVTTAAAGRAVRELLAARRGLSPDEAAEIALLPPRLEILDRDLLENRDRGFHPRLTWFVEARGEARREHVWVDATDGSILLAFSQLPHALDRRIHDAGSGSTLPGTLVRSEGQGATGDADADLAYQFSGDTYDYFFSQHGRDSYDGLGAALVSTIDYCPQGGQCPFANAFWDGDQMVYGFGFSAADDVAAHELTHAVTEHTAGLFYYMQSGALNESFSDIFGETVDLGNGAGDDAASVRWQMGEDVPGFGAIRDMEDPGLFDDPAKTSDAAFHCAASDNGGVHINSGVPNRAYSLMVDGGFFNGQSVSGIGLVKAGKIQYRALSEYLLSGSDFLDAYEALDQSCSDLVGTAGITADDCEQVKLALDAVEMSDPSPCAAALHQPLGDLCPAGEAALTLFLDEIETGAVGWTSTSAPQEWFLVDGFATSGTAALRGPNRATASDSSVFSPVLAVPASGGTLQFAHAFAFESDVFDGLPRFWDGGVLEVSTDLGATWNDLGSQIVAGAAYGGTLQAPNASNVLAARQAFVADSFGYVSSRVDLATVAGETIRLRFRIGTDSLVGDLGWYVDDVHLYQCIVTPLFADGFESGDASAW